LKAKVHALADHELRTDRVLETYHPGIAAADADIIADVNGTAAADEQDGTFESEPLANMGAAIAHEGFAVNDLEDELPDNRAQLALRVE
jgi:hypothetical protein